MLNDMNQISLNSLSNIYLLFKCNVQIEWIENEVKNLRIESEEWLDERSLQWKSECSKTLNNILEIECLEADDNHVKWNGRFWSDFYPTNNSRSWRDV